MKIRSLHSDHPTVNSLLSFMELKLELKQLLIAFLQRMIISQSVNTIRKIEIPAVIDGRVGHVSERASEQISTLLRTEADGRI